MGKKANGNGQAKSEHQQNGDHASHHGKAINDSISAPKGSLESTSYTLSDEQYQHVVDHGNAIYDGIATKGTLEASSYAQSERQYLQLMNKLRACGASLEIDSVRVAIIGNQSAGKSSVIEGISGIALPRAKGTCTRCPMEVRLAPTEAAWTCFVKLRFERGADGSLLDNIQETPFGGPIANKAEVEERLRRAQLAILNPSKDSSAFLAPDCDLNAKPELSFSTNLVCVDITGPGVPSLSFVDLPGFISNAAKGEEDTIDLIRNLAKETIKGGNCLILLTLTMTEDIQTQYGAMLSREVDEKGERTIGVLTKPDAVQEGDLCYWQDVLQGRVEALRHGYYVVKNPSTKDLEDGITYEEARAKERLLFQGPDWMSLPPSARSHLGTEKLVHSLSKQLETFIRKRVPMLTEQIRSGYDDVQAKLAAIPTEIGDDEAISHVDALCRAFSAELLDNVLGSVHNPKLVQALRREVFALFRNQIRLTLPIIIPASRHSKSLERAKELFAPHDDDNLKAVSKKMNDIFEAGEFVFEDVASQKPKTSEHVKIGSFTVLNLSDIRARKEMSITRELPGNVPYAIKVALMQQPIHAWRSIAEQCFHDTKKALLKHVDALVEKHFGQYEASTLKARVSTSMREKAEECGAVAYTVIMQLMSFEESVDTANHHYFISTREKVLEALMARREKIAEPKETKRQPGDGPSYEAQAVELLRAAGYNIDEKSLTRLAPEDVFQEELELGAEMLAYWKVAYKRVIDLVPGMIDILFVRKLAEDALACLHHDLGVQQKDAMERCIAYLQEDGAIVARRNELKARRARLQQGLEAIRAFETGLGKSG